MPATAADVAPTRIVGDDLIDVGGWSNEELTERLDLVFRQKAALDGAIVVLLGEVERRQVYRDDGATGPEPWAAERFGIAVPTARSYARLGEKAWDLPHLMGSLCSGELSLDKVRAVAAVATPENEAQLCDQARGCTVRELADVARVHATPGVRSARDRRSLRFNEQCRTMTVQLPAESYAEARTSLENLARSVPSDGETPWDVRLCDAFVGLIRSVLPGAPARATAASPYVVVVHTPLAALVDESGDASDLAGELERDGLISTEVVCRLACDATVVVAVDDDLGHTMYEGRARRQPSEAQRREIMRRDRCCRFPGCTNVTFTNVHHVVPWKPGGRTDLDNLALLCVHHHHLVHSSGWTMTGNANEELHFLGPTGRDMESRPSPRWGRVATGRRAGAAG